VHSEGMTQLCAAKDSHPGAGPALTMQVRDQSSEISTSEMDLSEERLDSNGPPGFIPQPHRSTGNEHREILSEEAFRESSWLEMKRAVRSGSFFMLMLMETERTSRVNRGETLLSEAHTALSSCTRETDISGWHEKDSALAVIFTDISNADREHVQKVVRAKVTAALCAELTPERVSEINFSFYFFPEDWERWNLRCSSHAKRDPRWPEQNGPGKSSRIAKRTLDIAGSIVALVLFSPLFLFISLAIKLTSRGPVLFKQERVGYRGVRFTFLKFRSMKCINDSRIHQEYVKQFIAGGIDSGQPRPNRVYKISADPRVTPFGRFLRKTSLDELPQFINVVKGEMSLVGPRPPIPYEVESYRPWHLRRVFEVKPGITGLWQVSGRSRTTFDEMVRLDLRYARNWSLWLDIKILLQTPEAILSGKGAY
jgi:lipopolysaccharide/colanic/teichoic acid biosynthesis glycosyltransferase